MRFTPGSACVAAFLLFLPFGLSAQDVAPGSSASKPSKPSKSQKHRQKKVKDELGDQLDRIFNEDLPYILTDEERATLKRLATNEEREQFIEMIWERRNPEPGSPVNLFKEEHYRRIAYANEHFSSGIPGWKTDRGHVYIVWGPPDEIESHPTGGTYDRPMSEGGGTTTTYPWEKWRYRHLDDVGDNVELEFVDPSGAGEYHYTMDPGEKDALTHVPGAGPTLSELLGLSTKAQRFSNTNGTTLGAPIGGQSASNDEFEALDRYARIMRAPGHFKELTSFVSSRIVANPLHLEYAADFFRVTSDSDLVPITVQIPNREMGFRDRDGVRSAVLNLYGRVTTLSGRVVQTFEDVIARDVPSSLFEPTLSQVSVYQKTVPLRPGLYKLDIVVKDVESGNVGVIGTALRVPRFEQETLDASSLVLADTIAPVSSSQVGLGPFVLGAYKVRPRTTREFKPSEKLGVYLQLYNLAMDSDTHQASFSVVYRISRDGQEVWRASETPQSLGQAGEQVTVGKMLPLASFSPGKYTFELTAMDEVTHSEVKRSAEFTIAPEASLARSAAH
jgi:GWxTD domain-containing protein